MARQPATEARHQCWAFSTTGAAQLLHRGAAALAVGGMARASCIYTAAGSLPELQHAALAQVSSSSSGKLCVTFQTVPHPTTGTKVHTGLSQVHQQRLRPCHMPDRTTCQQRSHQATKAGTQSEKPPGNKGRHAIREATRQQRQARNQTSKQAVAVAPTLLPSRSMSTKLGGPALPSTLYAPVAEPGLMISRPSTGAACSRAGAAVWAGQQGSRAGAAV